MNLERINREDFLSVDDSTGFTHAPITAERFTSSAFLKSEWQKLWPHVWLMGGRVSELEKAGDYICIDIGRESVLLVRGRDNAVRAFFNVCRHRGSQLQFAGKGQMRSIKCPYHHWEWHLDGSVRTIPDADGLPEEQTCQDFGLVELTCETWGGFIWFNMDPEAEPLEDYLDALTGMLEPYHLSEMTLASTSTVEWACNWKTAIDAANESYHTTSVHPQMLWYMDDVNTQLDFYGQHSRCITPMGAPSPRLNLEDPGMIPGALQQMMLDAGMDPSSYKGDLTTLRKDLQQHKRLNANGMAPLYQGLGDDQLTDSHHFFIFPNISLTLRAESATVISHHPHPTDPDRMTAHISVLQHPAAHLSEDQTLSQLLEQDGFNLPRVQRGLHSHGFQQGAALMPQEARIQRFHDVLDAYLTP